MSQWFPAIVHVRTHCQNTEDSSMYSSQSTWLGCFSDARHRPFLRKAVTRNNSFHEYTFLFGNWAGIMAYIRFNIGCLQRRQTYTTKDVLGMSFSRVSYIYIIVYMCVLYVEFYNCFNIMWYHAYMISVEYRTSGTLYCSKDVCRIWCTMLYT